MDTKSKNIKHSKILKAAALIIAVVMFFLSGSFASLFIKGFANYNIFTQPADFTNTTSFRTQMNTYIRSVINLGMGPDFHTFEQYKKTEDAKNSAKYYDNLAKNTKKAHELLNSSDIEIYVDPQNRYRYALTYNGTRYYFTYDGGLISYDIFENYDYVNMPEYTKPAQAETQANGNSSTTAVHVVIPETAISGIRRYDPYSDGGVPEYVDEISKALGVLNGLSSNSCYGEMSLEKGLELIESEKESSLANNYKWSNQGYNYDIFSSINQVNYAVIYKNSGVIVTNCGITAKDSREQILEKLGSTKWVEGIENGEYSLIIGEETKDAFGVYATLHEWLFGVGGAKTSSLEYNNYQDVSAAYFAIPDKVTGIDSFTVLEKAFDSYDKSVSLTLLLTLSLLFLAIGCAACIYLLAVAGKTADGIKLIFFDRIPFAVNAVLSLAVMTATVLITAFLVAYDFSPLMSSPYYAFEAVIYILDFLGGNVCVIIGLCVAVFFTVWAGLNTSIARNIRNKSFFRHTAVYWISKPVFILLKFLLKLFKKLMSRIKNRIERIKYIFDCDYAQGKGKKFLIFAFAAVIFFFVATPVYYYAAVYHIVYGSSAFGAFLLILGIPVSLAILGFVLLVISSLHRIMQAVSQIRNGSLGKSIDTGYMPPFMKRFADDILSMQEGLQNAVESAVKDQRMKAELITNVSHDLKTPLTSIVNYVDLLKKCDIENEDAKKYVAILDEKSHKMKKLIEDLVEASKASSGALEIHPVRFNLCEFANQSVGEHTDELKKLGIEIVLKAPDSPVTVYADAGKTSRVIENLFSNIRKYALEGTRVYVEVSQNGAYGSIVIKNISKNPLDVPADELTLRFVRGDASRSGEGSGLGLSIAKDLCELQNGSLLLQTDGDLFKAAVSLPLAK